MLAQIQVARRNNELAGTTPEPFGRGMDDFGHPLRARWDGDRCAVQNVIHQFNLEQVPRLGRACRDCFKYPQRDGSACWNDKVRSRGTIYV